MAAHRKSDRHRVYLCAVEFRKRALALLQATVQPLFFSLYCVAYGAPRRCVTTSDREHRTQRLRTLGRRTAPLFSAFWLCAVRPRTLPDPVTIQRTPTSGLRCLGI